MRRPLLLILPALCALALSACGQKQNTLTASPGQAQPLKLMLDWFPNADHVGLYEGLADGAFRKAGLDVHVEVPSDPSLPLKLVAAGKVDLAISYEPEVLLARDQNQPVASVAAIVQKPLTSIVSLGSQRILTPSNLRGKTVGDAGIPYQHAYLTTILNGAGVPLGSVHEINVGSNLVPAMLSGRVNATLGAYWNYEAIQLAQEGKRPNVIRVDHAGIPSYDELVLVARTTTLAQPAEANKIRLFVQALARGYEAARANPAAAVGNLVRANPGLDPRLQLASARATLADYFPGGGHPWGWQNPNAWNAYGQWMLSHHLISNPAAIPDASTNELLAGQGIG